MKRAPVWFTHGTTKERISSWWPWGLGLAAGAAYWYSPEPFERFRVGALYSVRRPVLRFTQWLEVRDVDPESFALDLPPDQIFGPLPLKRQVQFIVQALKEDNELADGYVTRLVIDHMDLSLDPPFLGDEFVDAGGGEIMRIAVLDYLDKRPGAKHKFFDADRFLRFMNVCANHQPLAKEFVEKHDGVNLLFKAMREASNEYARVLGMRAVTLFAFQQEKDGDIERRLVEGKHVAQIINFYRQSTGDPTDTRYMTLLLSSLLRLYPKEVYLDAVNNNLIKTAVNNLNISRYKGLPQHIRLIHDLEAARPIALGLTNSNAKRGTLLSAPESRKKRGWFGFFGSGAGSAVRKSEKTSGDRGDGEEEEAANRTGHPRESTSSPTPSERTLNVDTLSKQPRLRSRNEERSGVVEVHGYEAHRENPFDLPPLPPPKDPKAPVADLLLSADFMPVAIGILDVFPEYFEASRELVHMLADVKEQLTPFDYFEHRFFPVAIKLFHRHRQDADFEMHGVGRRLTEIAEWILNDKECAPWTDPDSKVANTEIKHSVSEMRGLLEERRKAREADQSPRVRSEPIPA